MVDRPVKENYVGVKMSDELLEILDTLVERYKMDRSRLIRFLIREQANRDGITVPEQVLYEST